MTPKEDQKPIVYICLTDGDDCGPRIRAWTPDPRFEDGDDPIRHDRESVVIRRARWAYAQADAMIAARQEPQS